MNTATHTQVKPQAPAPVLIDEVLKREVKKANAKQALKERIAATKETLNRQALAIDMTINLLETKLADMFRVLMDETAKEHDEEVLEALNLIEIGQDKLIAMRGRRYQDYNDCAVDLIQVGALVNAIARAYGDRDTIIGRIIKGALPCVDMMMMLIELEGDRA